jgi:NAD(P)-dependent dehydrogenase (short-subunit alcohol dehydrogenase family)
MNRKNLVLLGGLGIAAYLAYRVYKTKHLYSFRDKTVLITGGTRGLGLLMARRLAAEGAKLVVCARDHEEVHRAFHELADRGTRVIALTCDLRDPGQVRVMVQKARERLGAIDVLINNAGIISVGPVETMTLADFQDNLATNFFSAVHTIIQVLPEMRARGQGRIVNVSSIGGKVGVPHLLPYCASKFALTGLSEGLRSEAAKDGVVVTTVCPGLMRTGSPRNALFKGHHRVEHALFTLMDAFPGVSMNADSAAKRIIEACRYGEAEVVLSFPAKAAVLLHDLFPGLATDLNALINRLLPRGGGIGTHAVPGYASESKVAPSVLTALSDRAAEENNEMVAQSPPPIPAAT